MKALTLIFGLAICLSLGLVVAERADARPAAPALQSPAPAFAGTFTPEADPLAKKCSFNSDCPFGTCKGGQCGGCSFNSDCKGWGVCKGGHCGGCSFNSDCKGFGECRSGMCTKSPY
jgi:hypothetical protein